MNCQWVKSQITLYLYNELDDPERVEIEQHAENCASCAAEIEQERSVARLLDRRPRSVPDATMLAECRARLADALEEMPPRRLEISRLWNWMPAWMAAGRPALQAAMAAVLLLAGFAGGWAASRGRVPLPGLVQPRASEQEFSLNNISNIQSIQSDPQGNLEIVIDTTRRRVIRGSAEDPRVEQLLVYAANHYSNPGIRLDSIELLKDRASEADVRASLISALRTDQNAGVRLKALEALREFSGDPQVKVALLDTLRRDGNPGVRIEAIEQLGKLRDASAVPLLQQLAAGDPNNYVRLRSASALKDLNASEIY